MIDEFGNLKLADFGLGKIYADKPYLDTPCGSPCYAAPELLLRQKYNPLKYDVWSSGVVLYAMLCGYLPFDDQDVPTLYRKIIADELKFPSIISEEAKDLLYLILEKDPQNRPNIEQIFNHRWFSQGPPIQNISWEEEMKVLTKYFIYQDSFASILLRNMMKKF